MRVSLSKSFENIMPFLKFAIKFLNTVPLYLYNIYRFVKYSASTDSEESAIGFLTMAVHGIEKGLTLDNPRPFFGRERMMLILDHALPYILRYGTNNIQIHHVVKCVMDYRLFHEQCGTRIDAELSARIDELISYFPNSKSICVQNDYTKKLFFEHVNSDFASFSRSRHSCRNFTDEPVDPLLIDKAIALAQTSPSACNRQPVRLYVICSRDIIQKVLTLHGGTRGFAEKIDKLILVCGYIPCYYKVERDCVYTDCGIFAMNLLYSLHYYKIGACILNWSVLNENDRQCRKIVPVSNDEVICSLIACGNVPDTFKVCDSAKKDINTIIHHIL